MFLQPFEMLGAISYSNVRRGWRQGFLAQITVTVALQHFESPFHQLVSGAGFNRASNAQGEAYFCQHMKHISEGPCYDIYRILGQVDESFDGLLSNFVRFNAI